MLKKLLLICALGSTFGLTAQSTLDGYCSSKTVEQEIQARQDLSDEQKAELIAEHQRYEEAVSKKAREIILQKEDPIYVIPVVFHIFHKQGIENISEDQVRDCLRVMNEEFNGRNTKISQVVADFKDIVGDTKIEFRLATLDPQGNCTNGINRYYHNDPYFTSKTPIEALKPQYTWPSNKYLNCFIVGSIESDGTSRTLGYATFPGGNATKDGLVMVHDGIGAIGTGSSQNQSVATHEIGHWLGLSHTWGNFGASGDIANCSNTNGDGIDDTPLTKGSPSVCDLNEASCGSKANVQNFMDYSFCYCMFTKGQSAKMRATLETNTSRKNMWQPANLTVTGCDYVTGQQPDNLCKADFMVSTLKPICEGNSITYTDYSYGSVTTWNWSFPGGNPATSNEQNPTISYPTAGTYSATLTVGDGVSTVSTTKNSQAQVVSNSALALPYTQNFANLSALSPDFITVNADNDRTWELKTGAGFDDTKAVYIQNRSVSGSGKIDDLISNTVDLTGYAQPVLRFKYAYARKSSTSQDQLSIFVSSDCGVTWNQRKLISGTLLRTGSDTPTGDFVPTSSEWKSSDVSLSSFKEPGVRVKFSWKNEGGNNVYLDNINIGEINVSVSELSASGYNLGLYPNPADQSTKISFETDKTANSSLVVYDLVGKKVKTIFEGSLSAGDHNYSVDRDNLTPGIYFVKLRIDNEEVTKKLIFK